MKKIVILACQKANTVCTGAACLRAFNQRTRSFAQYQNEEIELEAFFRCNGCDVWDDGMQEKLERLIEQREIISREILALGFSFVTLDLQGLRSGCYDQVEKLI